MVSIKDVAKHAGTSFKTVSRVINNDPAVREETRDKVLRSIEALNYRPNSAARMMRNQKSGVIGFISDDVVTRPYAGELLLGAQEVASEHDKVLMVVNMEHDRRHRQQALDMLLERRVEGLVLATYYHREVEVPAELLSVPSVLVNCYSHRVQLPTFVPDDERAGYEATRLLVERGHRRIGLISLHPEVTAAKLRLSGYRRALEEGGLAFDSELVVRGEDVFGKEPAAYSVETALAQLMALSSRPTALVCGKDEFAMQAYFLLLRYGIRVGQEMALTSFDNQRLIAPNLSPGLTTMALPHLEMGRAAMRHLLGGETDNSTRLIPMPPIVRESHRVDR
ncbi:LacI family DNA-binding transcriptional regulator [Marinobacterium aestuariivivens]|uniref:LacI family DNA-binding transcriptional regulator n=1 Tax=Marinobacterium aestuariivivens TaxID=1698799 RepID=A0ABW2A5S2_9GAMM